MSVFGSPTRRKSGAQTRSGWASAHVLATGNPAFTEIRLSDVICDVAGRDDDRGSLQDLGNELRKNEGHQALVVRGLGACSLRIRQSASSSTGYATSAKCVGSSTQWATGFCLFAITADPQERYNRRRDEQQTPQEFNALDQRDQGEDEDYGQQVNRCVDFADVLVPNTTLKEWEIGNVFGSKVTETSCATSSTRDSRPRGQNVRTAGSPCSTSCCRPGDVPRVTVSSTTLSSQIEL
jgi:hypothetical protein